MSSRFIERFSAPKRVRLELGTLEVNAPKRIVLIGPSGSGKSELALRLAARLSIEAVDTDALIVERIGMTIGAFFNRFGEPAFRAIESQIIADVCRRQRVVIATGGGAVLSQSNWVAWRAGSVVLALQATPATLVSRVRTQAARLGDEADRPLLSGDAQARLEQMLELRSPLYARADASIDTEGRTASEVLDLAHAAIESVATEGRIPHLSTGTPIERSDIYISRGVRDALPVLVRQRWPKARRIWVVTDARVAEHWLASTCDALERAGYRVREVVVSPGETSKSMSRVVDVCDTLTMQGANRRDVVLALGGGVIGDLAGFVAAICLRGLALVQVPTTLLAMVDSSVGGKTGVNNPAGKNMIGAFYQPGLVVIDPDFLSTLPAVEYRSGMAEVIKHAMIQPGTPLGGTELLRLLTAADGLDSIDSADIERLLELNVAIKQSVVQADERESGLRMILNFGHTAGHAFEADGYRYRHGEAVALGMLVATEIASGVGRIDAGWDEALVTLIARAGLPVRVEGNVNTFMSAMTHDKKAVDGALNWVLPDRDAHFGVVGDVPTEIVTAALRSLGAT